MAENYKVLHIDQLSRISEMNNLEPYFRHKIKTKGGVLLTIDINEKDFTDDKAAKILDKAAINADKILAL